MQEPTAILRNQILQLPIHDMLHGFNNMSNCLYNAERAINNRVPQKEALEIIERAKHTLDNINIHVNLLKEIAFWESRKGFRVSDLVTQISEILKRSIKQKEIDVKIINPAARQFPVHRDSLPLACVLVWLLYWLCPKATTITMEITAVAAIAKIVICCPRFVMESDHINHYLGAEKEEPKQNGQQEWTASAIAVAFGAIKQIMSEIYGGTITYDPTAFKIALTLQN